MSKRKTRTERDSMGVVEVPGDACYGAQTQRAVDNFPVSGLTMPTDFIHALGHVKAACARANTALGGLDGDMGRAIDEAAREVAEGRHDGQFPVDVFQTGSGTSSNMNANEVIAHLATRRLGAPVHPNDHVNRGQSSNDVIPTAIHVAARLTLVNALLPALDHLAGMLERRAGELQHVVKTGRTHLMDAMPITLGQELGGWARQVRNGIRRLEQAGEGLLELALGGTAVGTGVNSEPGFAALVAEELQQSTGQAFRSKPDFFEALSAQDTAVEVSGQLRTVAVSLMKIANDLRWMNSGPLAGLGEISLPSLQPGSSIMPGKVNPVIPESVAMVAAQVMGNDATIAIAGQSGNFQLNVMLPVIALNLLQSMNLLANASRLLADRAVAGFTVNHEHIRAALDRNPILVTALNPIIGYEQGAAIAKRAYAEGRPVIDVALEETDIPEQQLRELLDPGKLV